MNGLLAHLTNQNLSTYDFHALACISNALETFRRKKPKTPINHRVPAASIWFVLCPKVIYRACQRNECADREVSGELWKGEPQYGYSIARWNFWRKRFGELECHPDATEETKEHLRLAGLPWTWWITILLVLNDFKHVTCTFGPLKINGRGHTLEWSDTRALTNCAQVDGLNWLSSNAHMWCHVPALCPTFGRQILCSRIIQVSAKLQILSRRSGQ